MKVTKFRFLNFAAFFAAFLAMSCTSYKQVPYIQNSGQMEFITQVAEVHESRILPRDLLSIIVSSPAKPEAALPYNLVVSIPYEQRAALTAQPTYQTYLVDNEGYIDFPIVGKLNVAGLTKKELEELILDKISGSFKDLPIVTVRFADFKVSVLGEVASPGTYNISNDKVNIFQALALAKDMTIYGMRENVKVIREDVSGKTQVYELDLTDASVVTSPCYHLQQNDVVYVTPNKAKAKGSDVGSTTSLWFSATSILVSLTSLLYNILH